MEIYIPADDGKKQVLLTDEPFDVPGWIRIELDGEEVDVHIDQLMPAIIAFDAKISRGKED